SVITACIALILFTAGVHELGRWLAASNSTDEKPSSWTFRNSVQTVLLILFAFVAGTSMIGIVHQVAWLATKDKPLLDSPAYRDRFRSSNNLKYLGLAQHNYHDDHDSFAISTFSADGEAWHSWQTSLLPYIDRDPLYQQIELNKPWSDPVNRNQFSTFIPTYQNPVFSSFGGEEDGRPAVSHYSGNIRLLRPNRKSSLEAIEDGPAHTLLGGEVKDRFKAWGDPANLRDPATGINRSPTGFGSVYSGGANMLFADGSVRFLSERVEPAILKALSTPSGGEEVSDDDY
ncbi:MAG: DUF1559 domain-containing protein, partial [Planctomycetes bacterium]|nr:DUF1559 domain-containing protein [Planctomycetota bacterium]